jgi:ABC-type transporter MlaC component
MNATRNFSNEVRSTNWLQDHVVTRRSAMIGSLGFLALGAAAADARAGNTAEAFVQANIDRSYTILNDEGLGASERELQFRGLLLSIVDVRRVAVFTLGPYARGAAQGSIDQFELAFADLIAAVYLRGLTSYTALKVTGSTERAQDDAVVHVAADRTSGTSSRLSIAFRVRRSQDGRQMITDLQIEGAWLALVQRAEFMAYLQQHGGDIAALALQVQSVAARIRSGQRMPDAS